MTPHAHPYHGRPARVNDVRDPPVVKAARHPPRAFTLIEVLATLVLIGIVIPVAMRGVSLAMATSANAKRTAEVAALAEAKLVEIVTTHEWEFGGVSGDFGANWPDYRWTIDTAPRDYNITEIVLRVTWQERGRDRQFTVSTLAQSQEASEFGLGGAP